MTESGSQKQRRYSLPGIIIEGLAAILALTCVSCGSIPLADQLAGVPFGVPPANPLPLFRHKEVFVEGENLFVAIDPGRWPDRVGRRYATHVVAHRTSWRTGDVFNDVIAPVHRSLHAGTLDGNFFYVWQEMALPPVEHLFQKTYDVVLDFGEDASYHERDIIDAIGLLARPDARPAGGFTLVKDPGVPGDFPVSGHEYDLGPVTLPFGLTVNLTGKIVYPATSTVANSPVSTDWASYPLVVIAHGADVPANPDSYLGFEYLAAHLASRGFIVATVALHELGRDASSTHIRAELLREHITALLSRPTVDLRLAEVRSRFEPDNVALVGHSMSGIAAVHVQRDLPAIKAVVGLAPAAGTFGNPSATVPLLIMHGTRDGNILWGQPYRLYDQAARPKHLVTMVGANHVGFSTVPGTEPFPVPATITAEQQRTLTKVYVTAFLASYLQGWQAYSELFDVHTIPPSLRGVRNALSFSYLPRSGLWTVIDDAQDAPGSAALNSLGEANHGTDLTALVQESLRRVDDGTSPCNFYVQDTDGLRVAWEPGHRAAITFDLGDRDLRAYEFLSVRVAQRFRATDNRNSTGRSQEFHVTLSDTHGSSSYPISSASYGEVLYPDDIGVWDPFCAGTKSVLQTIRIPVRAFSANASPLDRRHVASVTFGLYPATSGELIFDDLELIGLDLTLLTEADR